MTEKTFTIKDMIGFAAAGNAADFQAAFDQLTTERAATAVEGAREYVAQTFTNQDSEEEEVTDEDPQASA